MFCIKQILHNIMESLLINKGKITKRHLAYLVQVIFFIV